MGEKEEMKQGGGVHFPRGKMRLSERDICKTEKKTDGNTAIWRKNIGHEGLPVLGRCARQVLL